MISDEGHTLSVNVMFGIWTLSESRLLRLLVGSVGAVKFLLVGLH